MFAVSAIVFRLAHRQLGFWTIDDAGITYAAAYEFADHGSLATSVEGTPVESYSNPLLFFVVALLRFIGVFDPVRTHLHLEMLVFAVMVTLVWSMLRAWTTELAAVIAATMFAAIELLTPATWTWYRSGLENVWVSAGIVLLLWSFARAVRGVPISPWFGAIGFLVAITRPEAPVYVAAYFALLLGLGRPADRPFRVHLRTVALVAAVTLALYIAFLCWRRIGYGDWWPNTYYAKVGNGTIGSHVRDYVVGHVFRYGWSIAFAMSALGLLLLGKLERIAQAIISFAVAALTLPITAGADWMGEHRFATAFLAVSHLAFATLFAICVERIACARDRRPISVVVLALVLPVLLLVERNPLVDRVPVNEVTLGHIAHGQGGLRWEHQMRLGLPNAVVMMPDAGGSLLVGGMQFMDSAGLADFQQAHILRRGGGDAMALLNQYHHQERRPDLIHFNLNSATVDPNRLRTQYFANETHLAARRDLVEVATLDPAAQLIFDVPDLQIYLSPETVRRAAPGALVRCELIVVSRAVPDLNTRLRATLDGDEDVIFLSRYLPTPIAQERRGMLVGAPARDGSYPITIELIREGQETLRASLFTLRVTRDTGDLAQVASELVRDVSPQQAARRIAWLREQLVPRLTTRQFHRVLHSLGKTRRDGGSVGRYITTLRTNARLAAFEDLPATIRDAEANARRALLATCPSATDDDALARRMLCLGRAVDELRRLGYLGTDAGLGDVDAQLDRVTPELRYRMLVGLTLATPSEMTLQRALLDARAALAKALPDL